MLAHLNDLNVYKVLLTHYYRRKMPKVNKGTCAKIVKQYLQSFSWISWINANVSFIHFIYNGSLRYMYLCGRK